MVPETVRHSTQGTKTAGNLQIKNFILFECTNYAWSDLANNGFSKNTKCKSVVLSEYPHGWFCVKAKEILLQ
jgi:hypothetical protein